MRAPISAPQVLNAHHNTQRLGRFINETMNAFQPKQKATTTTFGGGTGCKQHEKWQEFVYLMFVVRLET
eukprot:1849476-Amphidinium_carterae.1